jgi:uncharacterized protein (UPF0303 family)
MPGDIERIKAQEEGLVFHAFSELDACAIGNAIRDRAVRETMPIVVDIRFWNRPLFYAALPGSSAGNPDWVRRKAATVQRFSKSSFRVLLEQKGERVLPLQWGLENRDYALSGGGFPIHARGFGVIGAITVSGLHERRDHAIVVDAICDHLGRAREEFAFTAE